MARGRFISKSISQSRKFSALPDDTARLAYLMILPHVDREGRLEADPEYLRGIVFTRNSYSLEQIAQILQALADVDLITLYRFGEVPILEVADFAQHNTPHHKEADSEYPAPSDERCHPHRFSSMAQACAKHEASTGHAWREEEVKEEVKEETPPIVPPRGDISKTPPEKLETQAAEDDAILTDLVASSKPEPPADAESAESRPEEGSAGRAPPGGEWWLEHYNAHKPPAWIACELLNDKRRRRIRAFVREHGEAQARVMFANALRFVRHDEWWATKPIKFDTIWTKNHLLEWHEAWLELQSNPLHSLSPANRRLAEQAAGWARALGATA